MSAQLVSLTLWCALSLVTLWLLRNKEVHFPLAFALLYLGRPVGWGLIYLEVVVVGALWPLLKGWERYALLTGALILTLTHWVALILTLRGVWVRLFTLQSAALPWETWSILPLLWLLLVLVGRRRLPVPT